jgi:hypothetical protein
MTYQQEAEMWKQAAMANQQPQQPQWQPRQVPQNLGEEGTQWWQNFESYTGIKPEEFINGANAIDQLTQIVQAQQQSLQETQLRMAWGNDYDANVQLAAQSLNSLPPQLANQYRTPRGVVELVSKLKGQQQQPQTQTQQLPNNFQQSTVQAQPRPQQGGGPIFKKSDIDSLSKEEYGIHAAEIQNAYAEGRVDTSA